MNSESKGRGSWFNKIYSKLETILVEGNVSLDSDEPPGQDSVREESEKLAENHSSSTIDLQTCYSPSKTPSDHKFDISPSFRLEEQMEGDSLKDSKLGDHGDCNQTVATFLCREQPITVATEIQAASGQDKVASIRAFTSNSMKVNQDEFFIDDFDAAPLDTIDLYDMTFREDPSDFDDNLLYAARDRTRQLRSFKRKVMDALTSKRRREKEYEQLAIWFGDADMGSDLTNTKEHATTSLESKTSQSNVPFASEDSEWEIL